MVASKALATMKFRIHVQERVKVCVRKGNMRMVVMPESMLGLQER